MYAIRAIAWKRTRAEAMALVFFLLGASCAVLMLGSTNSDAYVSHTYIDITCNDDFDGDHGVNDGSGTQEDPWVISNWAIWGDATNAISIGNTTDHFVVRDVYLNASIPWNDKIGVYLYNVTNGSVESSSIYGEFEYGVYLRCCNDSTVLDNDFSDIDYISGICAEYSTNVTISGNQLSNCGYTINLYLVDTCVVSNNTLTDELSYPGIRLYDVGNATVSGNSISTIYDGMQIAGTSTRNVSVTGNTVKDCTQIGIGAYSITQGINISLNHLEYTGIGLQQCDGAVVSGNRFVNMSTCSISSVMSVNVTMTSNEMEFSGISIQGQVLREFNTHSISTDNTVNDRPVRFLKNTSGISLDGVSTGQMFLVNCTGAEIKNISSVDGYGGLSLYYSKEVLVHGCNLSGNYYTGLDVLRSENVTVSQCRICDTQYYGVLSIGSLKNATFLGNNISRNSNCGMKMSFATQLNITGNVVTGNGHPAHQCGIDLYRCTRGNITENHIADNYAGIYLSTNTIDFNVFRNNFINNTYQVWDVMSNTWDDGLGEGNYWDDYTGDDSEPDGIGDTPYVIDGDSQDNYPLMQPIPEFSEVIVPVLVVMGLMLLFVRTRSGRSSGGSKS